MEFIEVITEYLKTAPIYEVQAVNSVVEARLKSNPQFILDVERTKLAIKQQCIELFNGSNKLEVVKWFKEMSGMGLKDAKDWCDANIFNLKKII